MLRDYPNIKSLFMAAAKTMIIFFSIVWCFLLLSLIGGGLASLAPETETETPLTYHYGQKGSENQLLSIPINGVILGDELEADPTSFLTDFALTYGYDIKEKFYEAAEREDIKGVILEINSPGGTIYGSQAIADGVKYYREKTGKPVYSFVSGVAASGGYWAGASGDRFIADYGTALGSIGVISGPYKYYDQVISEDGGILAGGVVTQNGIQTTTFTAGTAKDFGNPYRPMTEMEVAKMQQIVNNEYDRFVNHVSQNRRIDPNQIRDQVGAYIYDPTTALSLRLIDEVNNRDAAYQALANQVGAGEDFEVLRYESDSSFVDEVLSATQRFYQPQQATKAQINPLCSATTQVLAYHGDLTTLCQL